MQLQEVTIKKKWYLVPLKANERVILVSSAIFTLIFLYFHNVINERCKCDYEIASASSIVLRKEEKYRALTGMKSDQIFSKSCYNRNRMGKITINYTVPRNFEEVEDFLASSSLLSGMEHGGLWKPRDCRLLKKIAVIVPYGKRMGQLRVFMKHIHPILQRNLIYYRIFVIEQSGIGPFNKGKIFNSGVREALKYDNFDCFILHDINMLVTNDHLPYDCAISPYFMDVKVNGSPNRSLLGKVITLTLEHYQNINGFSNRYRKCGHEAKDMYFRLYGRRYKIFRPPLEVGDFINVGQKRRLRRKCKKDARLKMVMNQSKALHDYKSTDEWIYAEGFRSVEYNLITSDKFSSFTYLTVNFDKNPVTKSTAHYT